MDHTTAIDKSTQKTNQTHRIESKFALGSGQEKSGDPRIRKPILNPLRQIIPSTNRTRPPAGAPKSQLLQHLIFGNLLSPPKHIDLAQFGEPKLMDLHLSPERDEPHQSILRQQPDRLLQRRFDIPHLLLDHARVEHEHEDRRRRGGGIGGEGVLDGGVLGVELAGEIGLGDERVVRREVIALVAEWADPDLGGEVDAGERVEDGGAGLAAERRVGERGDVGVEPDRGDAGGEWDHALAGLDLRAGPHVPRHADAVDALGLGVRHLRHCNFALGGLIGELFGFFLFFWGWEERRLDDPP